MNGADVISLRRRRSFDLAQLAHATGIAQERIAEMELPDGWFVEVTEAERTALILAGGFDGEGAELDEIDMSPEPVVQFEVDRDWYRALISNSEVQAFKRCRRKWWLQWVLNLGPIAESPVGVRRIGDRVHRALRYFYDPASIVRGTLAEHLEDEILSDTEQLTEAQLTDDTLIKQFRSEADLERIMVEGYVQWVEETGADAELEPLGSEVYVQVPAPWDAAIGLIGRLDARFQRTSDGAPVFLDHKVVGDLTTPTVRLSQDEQMLHYHLLQHTALLGQRTVGAIYNMLRRVKRTARAKPPFYARQEIRHNRHELASYADRLRWTVAEMLATRTLVQAMPVDEASRAAYPSPRRDCAWDCPFVAVCPLFDDGSAAEAMLAAQYREIDPLQRYVLDDTTEVEAA